MPLAADSTIWHSQNFIRSVSVARRIVRLAHLTGNDLVVEVGPGRGIITKELSKVCRYLIAVEYDRSLYHYLKRSLGKTENLDLVCADFRRYDLPGREYKVFASIPFEITSDIMTKITGSRLPTEAYLIMQMEAARRFAGHPYDRESLRSLLIKARFELAILHAFRRTDFWPTPKADVVLLRLRKRCRPILAAEEDRKYRDLLCFAFSEQGPDVAARLGRILTSRQITRLARDSGFSVSARVVDLSFPQWVAVFRYYLTGVVGRKQKLVEGAERRLFRRQAGLTKIHRSRARPGWQRSSDGGQEGRAR